jgi:site-specific recombinase XerD
MATIKLVLDKRRKKKSGTYPLVIRIRHKGKYVDVPTKQELFEHQFDNKREIVLGNVKLNKILKQEVDNCIEKVGKLIHLQEEVSIGHIKALFGEQKKDEPTIIEFWNSEVNRLIEIGKAGNAGVYLSSLMGLKRVMNLDIMFKELKHITLLEAETTLLKKGVKLNTISVYMRTLRAICNKAILLDIIDQSWYPFYRYKIKKGKSVPKSLDIEQMRCYFKLDLTEEHPLYRSYCIGKLIFLMRGINFKDLVKLTDKHVIGNRIVYERSKTKTLYSIEVENEMNILLKRLSKGGTSLIGIMCDEIHKIDHDIEVLKRYKQQLHVENNHLKKIGELLNLDVTLSTYVMRYSYANIARTIGVSIEEISYLLGHKSSIHSVTEIYLNQYDFKKLDIINRKIINAITGR